MTNSLDTIYLDRSLVLPFTTEQLACADRALMLLLTSGNPDKVQALDLRELHRAAGEYLS